MYTKEVEDLEREFAEIIQKEFSDIVVDDNEFKKRKKGLLKKLHPDNKGNEILFQMAKELCIEDVDIFEYCDNSRKAICGLKRTVNLDCLKIPKGVETICDGAFWHKEAWYSKPNPSFNVKKLILPKSLKLIGKNAFRNAHGLYQVIFEHNEEQEVRIYQGAFSNTNMYSFDFKCKMYMEAVSPNEKGKYTIFHECLFIGKGELPFDVKRVELFGYGKRYEVDGIWNCRKEAKKLKEYADKEKANKQL